MPAKKPSPVIEFVLAQLKKNPKAPFAEIVEAGKKAGHKIVPVVYGRARVMAGLSPKKGKGAAKKQAAAKAAAPAPTVKRGPGRPRKEAQQVMAKRGPGRPRKTDELTHLVARLRQVMVPENLRLAVPEILRSSAREAAHDGLDRRDAQDGASGGDAAPARST